MRKRITFSCFNFISLDFIAWGSKGWPNVERTRLPPGWPGFKSRRQRHNYVG